MDRRHPLIVQKIKTHTGVFAFLSSTMVGANEEKLNSWTAARIGAKKDNGDTTQTCLLLLLLC